MSSWVEQQYQAAVEQRRELRQWDRFPNIGRGPTDPCKCGHGKPIHNMFKDVVCWACNCKQYEAEQWTKK